MWFYLSIYIIYTILSILSILSIYLSITIYLSLSIYHYLSIIIYLSLSIYHYLSIIIYLSLSIYHYLSIIIYLSLSIYHYLSIIIYLSIYLSIQSMHPSNVLKGFITPGHVYYQRSPSSYTNFRGTRKKRHPPQPIDRLLSHLERCFKIASFKKSSRSSWMTRTTSAVNSTEFFRPGKGSSHKVKRLKTWQGTGL